MSEQIALFSGLSGEPEGLRYAADFVSPETERDLIGRITALPLKPFQFGQYEGKRRVASFGFSYDYTLRRLRESEPIPDWLEPILGQVEAFGGPETRIGQVLCTEYDTGVGIGWHRDKPSLRQGIRAVARLRLQIPVPAGGRREMATLHARCRAALALHDVGRLPRSLGAQHPRRGSAQIFHHVPDHGRTEDPDTIRPNPALQGRNGKTHRQRRSSSPWRTCAAMAGDAHVLARRRHHAGDRAALRPRRIPAAAVASVLVSIVRRRDGHGLAFVRHHDQRHRRLEARARAAATANSASMSAAVAASIRERRPTNCGCSANASASTAAG